MYFFTPLNKLHVPVLKNPTQPYIHPCAQIVTDKENRYYSPDLIKTFHILKGLVQAPDAITSTAAADSVLALFNFDEHYLLVWRCQLFGTCLGHRLTTLPFGVCQQKKPNKLKNHKR